MLIISTRRTYASQGSNVVIGCRAIFTVPQWQQCRAIKSRCHSFSNDGTTWALRANHLPPQRWWPRRSKVLNNGVLPTWTLRFKDDSRRQKRRNPMNASTMRLSPLLVVLPRARRSSSQTEFSVSIAGKPRVCVAASRCWRLDNGAAAR